MPSCRRPCALVALLALASIARADDGPAGRRVVVGQVAATDGRPVAEGRIFFRADRLGLEYLEAWSAPLGADGRFRAGLADATQRSRATGAMEAAPASGPLVFEVVAPGFRGRIGKVAAADQAGPPAEPLAVRLTAEPWRGKDLLVVDNAGRPVAGAAVTLSIAASRDWSQRETDATGRCRVEIPPSRNCGIEARAPGSVPTSTVLSGTAAEPERITLPLRPPIRGRVVDAGGGSGAGLAVGRLLVADADGDAPPPVPPRFEVLPFAEELEALRTDAEGRFDLNLPFRPDGRSLGRDGVFRLFSQTVCFDDAESRRRAFLAFDYEHQREAYEVALRPLRSVRVPIEHEVTPPSGRLRSWWNLYVPVEGDGPRLGFIMSGPVVGDGAANDRIEVDLPPGRYRFELHSADPTRERGTEELTADLTVPDGAGPVTLPGIRLKQLGLDRLVGRPAPEIDARALDTGAPVRLADHKGRVVVLDFWGYWCGPCLGALPELIRVQDEFRDRPVTIIALHDMSIQDRQGFDDRLAGVRREVWGDRDLPFLVAFDRPAPDLPAGDPGIGRGVSCGLYDVSAFPTTLLIDQAGRIVETVNPRDRDQLVARINALLARPTP